jgi:hypothetical protein
MALAQRREPRPARTPARCSLASGDRRREDGSQMDGAPPTRPVRLATPLGTVELSLPDAAELASDPGVPDGEMLVWAPTPQLGAFSVSHGPAAGRRAEDLLALERAFGDRLDIDAEERDELRLCVETHSTRDIVVDAQGHRTDRPESTRRERVRFRFWESDGEAVRAGYRLDESAPDDLKDTFDRITDSVRLVSS